MITHHRHISHAPRHRGKTVLRTSLTFLRTFSQFQIRSDIRKLASLVYPCCGIMWSAMQTENDLLIDVLIDLGADLHEFFFRSFYCTPGAARSLLRAGVSAIELFHDSHNIRRVLMEKWDNDLLQKICNSIPEDVNIPRMESALGFAALLGSELLTIFLIGRGAEVTDATVKYARKHKRLAETLRQVVHLNDSKAANKIVYN